MKEQNEHLQPETIDHVIEGGELSQQDHQTTRLIQHLHASSQVYARENERSLDRVWSRLIQSQEHSIFLQVQWKQPEGKIIAMKEKKAMEDSNVSWGMNPSVPLSPAKKRSSILRLVSIGLVAAIAIVTILSFTIFSGVLRPAHQTAGKGSSTITGAQPNVIRNGKLVCSVGVDNHPLGVTGWNPTVSWSAQGKIAAAYDGGLTMFSAKDCSAKHSMATPSYYVTVWSPDGKRLVTADTSTDALNVLDSNGNSITNIPFTQLGAISVGQIVWSSDSKKLIFISLESNHQNSIKSVDAASGSNVKTLVKIPGNGGMSGFTDLSPDGRYVLVTQFNKATKQKDHSIWDVNAGKKVSDLPSDDGKGGFGITAFSPDGSLIAVGGEGKVRIYTTANGKLLTSFDAPDASARGVSTLAWSPDGKYLAEGANSINIYDITAKKIATTFGKVDAQHEITSLAWAPDSNGLVSSTSLVKDDGHSQTPVNVWALI